MNSGYFTKGYIIANIIFKWSRETRFGAYAARTNSPNDMGGGPMEITGDSHWALLMPVHTINITQAGHGSLLLGPLLLLETTCNH